MRLADEVTDQWTKKGAAMTLQHLREQLDQSEAEVERLREALKMEVDWIVEQMQDAYQEASNEVGNRFPDAIDDFRQRLLNGKESR